MKIEQSYTTDFVAIQWNEPEWEFDYPSLLIQPFIRYHEDASPCELVIENAAIEMLSGGELKDEDVSADFGWRGWNLDRIKQVARNRMKGKDEWCSKGAAVLYQKIETFSNGTFRVIEEQQY